MDECRRVRFHGAADGRRFRAGAWHNARHASADRLAVDETGFGGSAARTAEALKNSRFRACCRPYATRGLPFLRIQWSIIALQTLVIRSGYGYRQQARYCGVSTKAKKIGDLGSGYTVMASVGHIRDLAQPSPGAGAEKAAPASSAISKTDSSRIHRTATRRKPLPT